MKIVVVSAVYPPEPLVSATISQSVAQRLMLLGHAVTVLCPTPSRPIDRDYRKEGYLDRTEIRCEEGVEIVRLRSFTAPSASLLLRLRESFSFGVAVCEHLRISGVKVDVLYANSWPLLSQLFIAIHCAQFGVPFVLHIQDLYPESLLLKLPRMTRFMVGETLIALDRWLSTKADRVIVISNKMRRHYIRTRKLDESRVILVRNWFDDDLEFSGLKKWESRIHYQVDPDKFTFLYLGNIGPVAGLEYIINCFHETRSERAQLIVVGGGTAKESCVALTKSLGAKNISFVTDSAVENVPRLQSMADVLVLPMRKQSGISSVPSKLAAYMLSGKPILASVDLDSDTAECVADARCGWAVEPGNSQELKEAFIEIQRAEPKILEELGAAARKYGLLHFGKRRGTSILSEVILQRGTASPQRQNII